MFLLKNFMFLLFFILLLLLRALQINRHNFSFRCKKESFTGKMISILYFSGLIYLQEIRQISTLGSFSTGPLTMKHYMIPY